MSSSFDALLCRKQVKNSTSVSRLLTELKIQRIQNVRSTPLHLNTIPHRCLSYLWLPTHSPPFQRKKKHQSDVITFIRIILITKCRLNWILSLAVLSCTTKIKKLIRSFLLVQLTTASAWGRHTIEPLDLLHWMSLLRIILKRHLLEEDFGRV